MAMAAAIMVIVLSAVSCCVGGSVASGASSIVKYVVADDGPYALEPAKLAMIWYSPGTSGLYAIA